MISVSAEQIEPPASLDSLVVLSKEELKGSHMYQRGLGKGEIFSHESTQALSGVR